MNRSSKISHTLRQIIFARDAWRCAHCGAEAVSFTVERLGKTQRICFNAKTADGKWMEIDHIVPYCETQDNSINNLCCSCWKCNNAKSNHRWKIPKNFPLLKLFRICDL